MGEIVKVTLTNTEAYVTDCSAEMEQKLRKFWSFYPTSYRWAPQHKLWLRMRAIEARKALQAKREPDFDNLPGWDGRIRLYKNGAVPAGLFVVTREAADIELGAHFKVTRKLPKQVELKEGLPASTEQYRYQDECVDAMVSAIPTGGGIVLAGTGTGKTATCSRFFSRVACECLFVVDQLDLLYQAKAEIEKWLGEPVGHVGEGEFVLGRVTVGTVQTLALHLNDKVFSRWYKRVQLIVIDELHEQLNRRNFNVLEKVQPIARFGLTATLQLKRKDVRFRAHAFAGPVLYEFPLMKGVEQGVLSEGKVLQLAFPPNVDWEVEKYSEHYQGEVIDHEVKQRALQALVTSLLMAGRYVIVLAELRKHIEVLDKLFEDIPHKIAYGSVSVKDRNKAVVRFEKGKIKLIIASKVFRKGVNIKRVDAIVDTAEMKNKDNAQQKYGRGVRLHKDKTDLIYVDIATQGDCKFGKRSRARAKALRALGVKVKKVNVASPQEAVKTVRKYLCLELKPVKKQLELSLTG